MTKYTLYVGANNETKQVELEKLCAYLDTVLQGYTIIHAVGAWNGENEPSVLVTIFTDKGAQFVEDIAQHINTILDQYAVLVEYEGRGVLVNNPSK